jgi:CO dehydrogenase maturation factor
MKLAVCGKGGVGKTFIAGTLASRYAHIGHPVIAIDADPSPNLAITLGLSYEEAARIQPIAENADLVRLKTGTEFSGVFRLSFTVNDIVSKYAVKTPSGASLMVMGTVKSLGSGCTCPANSLVRALIRHLVVERDDVIIMDMEAGIEHIGRGTAEHVDAMLVVSDANRKSLEIAEQICRLAKESDIALIGLVANRINSVIQENLVKSFADKNDLRLLAVIPFDTKVAEAGITGEPVEPETSVAVTAIGKLADTLSMNLAETGKMR